jgi:O-antigen/teichoic acid export membrane protein
MFQRIARNAASLISAQAAAKVAGLITTIVIARALHASGYGLYAAAWAFGLLVAALADGGLAYFVAVEVARVPRTARRFFWTALALRLVLCIAALGAAAAIVPLLRFHGLLATAALLQCGSSLLDGISAQVFAYYRAIARMHIEAAITTFGRFAFVVATLAALAFSHTIVAVSTGACIASLVTVSIALVTVAKSLRPAFPRRAAAIAVGRGALPFAANGLLTQIFFRIDVLMLRFFGIADAAIGAYSGAYRMMEVPRLAFGSISAGALAEAATLAHPRDRGALSSLGARVTNLTLWCTVPASLLFLIAPQFLVRLVYGPGFEHAAALLQLLAPMPLLMASNSVAITLVNAIGGQRTVTRIFMLLTIVNIVLNLWAIPTLGATGAALVTIATELVELVAFVLVIRRRIGTVRMKWPGISIAAPAGVVPGSVAR